MSATVPLWLDEPHDASAPLSGELECDVCIVGAGIGGIATAWQLSQRGIEAVVLDAREVASGASGRNGGFFIAGAAPMYDDMRRRWGIGRAARIYAATLEAQLEMLSVAESIGARDHFRMTGMLRLGVDAAEAVEVRAHHAALTEDGFPGELVEEDGLPEVLRRPGRLGLLTPHDGGVHPVRWIRALAGASGARIFEGTRVTGPPVARVDGVQVATEGGMVHARTVIVAMDGGLAALVPAATAVRPKRLNMVATAPGADPVLPYPVYARHGYEYAQQLPDGRVTLGGFSDLDGEAAWTDRESVSAVVQGRLEAYLRDELSVRARVTHRWAGVVGYAEDPLPVCGPVPGSDGRVLCLGGYNGTGHVQAWVAARYVAGLVAGERGASSVYAAL